MTFAQFPALIYPFLATVTEHGGESMLPSRQARRSSPIW